MVVPEGLAEKATSPQQSEDRDGVGEPGIWGGAAQAGDQLVHRPWAGGTPGARSVGGRPLWPEECEQGKHRKREMRTEWVQGEQMV